MAPPILPPSPTWLKRMHLSLASSLAVIGLLVLLGWIQMIDPLVVWGPGWAPFTAGAAAGFAIFGATLLAIEAGWRRAALLAVIPGIAGVLSILQEVAGFDNPLDALFARDWLLAASASPGRMSTAVAFSFVLGGCTLPLIALRRFERSRTLGLALGGSIMTAAGLSTILGYALDLPAICHWGSGPSVSPGAGLLLLLLGANLLILAWREHQAGQPGAPAWLPMPVVTAAITLTLILYAGLRERELAYLGTSTQAAINNLASTINLELEHQTSTLERIASRWSTIPDFEAIRETDARILIDDAPACTAVVWLSPDMRTSWVFPMRGNEALLSLDHSSEAGRRVTLETARQTAAAAFSGPLPSQRAGPCFACYAPVYREGRLSGYIGAEYSYPRFFNAIDRRLKLSANYHVTLFSSGIRVHEAGTPAENTSPNLRLESAFSIFDRRLRVEMSPSASLLARSRRPLPEVALVAGFGITFLLGITVHLARNARKGLRESRMANIRLLAENEERRRIEDMLKISDERLRVALDSTQIGIFEWNLPGNQLYYSPGVWSMLGYLPGIIPPTPEAWTALIHPDDLPAYRKAIEQQLSGALNFIEPEYRVRTATGEWLWLYVRSKADQHSPSGAPQRIIGTLQDITARKNADHALRESQAAARKLSLVASRTDNLVIIARPDGSIDWVNESFERVMEYPLADIAGRSPAAFMIGPETSPHTVRRIKAALLHGEGISTDIVNYSKSGKKYHLHLEIQPVRNETGVLENFIAILVDITARVETEQNLRRAKSEADAASRAKSEFLASMSHEIRTPMNGVIGMTSLLLDTRLDHEQRDCVATIRSSGEALLTIINDILDFSKIESGKMEIEHQPFELSVCIEEALDLFSVPAAEKNLELCYHIDPAVPAWIQGDVTRLRQIVVNLVNNAVKFTPAGRISVFVELDGAQDIPPHLATPAALRVSVSDTGIGIPPDRMNRLFRPFSQVDSSTTRKYGGTGLGLAICHRLVALMGGTISVSSTPGQGTTFTFTLRTESVPTPPGWGFPEMPVRLNYAPVLCITGNPVTQKHIQAFFQTWGARTLIAGSPAAAEQELSATSKPSVAAFDQTLCATPAGKALLNRITALEIPLLLLLQGGQSLPPDLADQNGVATVPQPLRNLALVRGVQTLFSTLPDSTPPFALAAERPLAKDIPLNVLLVEDNTVNQKVALRFLSRLGYRADAVANGLEAVTTLEARRYDLVLMDLQMPEMDGFEASRQIRQRLPEDRQPRIVALTANALQGDRELCIAAGMNDYIAKPVKLHEIADAIRRQFTGSRAPFQFRTPSSNSRPPTTS